MTISHVGLYLLHVGFYPRCATVNCLASFTSWAAPAGWQGQLPPPLCPMDKAKIVTMQHSAPFSTHATSYRIFHSCMHSRIFSVPVGSLRHFYDRGLPVVCYYHFRHFKIPLWVCNSVVHRPNNDRLLNIFYHVVQSWLILQMVFTIQ